MSRSSPADACRVDATAEAILHSRLTVMRTEPANAWNAALEIIQRLRAAGHSALLAGGCVRDRLLGRAPKDYDVATDARPERVKAIFPRARLIGAKFGVVLVHRFGCNIEVATFRSDGPYSDGRHPDDVTFGTDLEDSRRRDFTINGLFFDPVADRVIDYVNGQADLSAGIIRTIGDPDQRLAEDHLRMLRAVRLAARLGFVIEPSTAAAIRRLATHLRAISPERIWIELEQILVEPTRATGWVLITGLGLHDHLCADWEHCPDHAGVKQRRLAALPDTTVEASLGLAALLCDDSPQRAENVCRGLRLSNRLTDAVVWLVRFLPAARDADSLELADLKTLMAQAPWPQLLELLRADLLAADGEPGLHERLCKRAAAIPTELIAPPPLLTGDDLAARGVPAGPKLGKILRALYRAQLNEQIATREQAWALAQTLVSG